MSDLGRLRVRAQSSPWWGGVEVAILGERLANGCIPCGEVIMRPVAQGGEIPRALVLRNEEAQALMDDLWNSGIRPTEGAGTAGAMRATERHIADLRAVAFKALGIEQG
jgi:hypothetical protein